MSGAQPPQQPPKTGSGGSSSRPRRRRDPRKPRNFDNPYNSHGVEEEDLPPSHKANDFQDTKEYVHSSDISGPCDSDRREGNGWDSAGYYSGSNSGYTHGK